MTVLLNGKRYFACLTVLLWRCCKMTGLFKRLTVFWFLTVRPSAVHGLPKYDGIPPSTGTDVQHEKITSGIFPRTTLQILLFFFKHFTRHVIREHLSVGLAPNKVKNTIWLGLELGSSPGAAEKSTRNITFDIHVVQRPVFRILCQSKELSVYICGK